MNHVIYLQRVLTLCFGKTLVQYWRKISLIGIVVVLGYPKTLDPISMPVILVYAPLILDDIFIIVVYTPFILI